MLNPYLFISSLDTMSIISFYVSIFATCTFPCGSLSSSNCSDIYQGKNLNTLCDDWLNPFTTVYFILAISVYLLTDNNLFIYFISTFIYGINQINPYGINITPQSLLFFDLLTIIYTSFCTNYLSVCFLCYTYSPMNV